MKSELSTGEWQIDPATGQRFRTIPGGREWEMTFYGTSGFMTASQLERYNAHPQQAEPIAQPEKCSCPFRSGHCARERCALFLDGGCTLAQISDGVPAKETVDLQCPFSRYKCRTDCALYRNGCTLTINSNLEKGRFNKWKTM